MQDDGDGNGNGDVNHEATNRRTRVKSKREVTDRADSDDDTETRTLAAPVDIDGSDHLDELMLDHDVVLADFYADWCGPCKNLEPVVESIATDTEAVVAKVDVDTHQALAASVNVRGVPTLLLYVDGRPVERLVGLQEEARLRSLVTSHT